MSQPNPILQGLTDQEGVPGMEPLLVPMWSTKADKPTAAKALGCDRNKIRDLVYSGEIPSVMFGGRRMILVDDLKAFVNRLRAEQKIPAGGRLPEEPPCPT